MSAAIAFLWVLNPSNAERRLSPLTHNRCGLPVHFRSPSFFGLGSLAHLMWTTGTTGLKVNGCAFFRFQRGAKGRGAAPYGTAPGSLLRGAKRYCRLAVRFSRCKLGVAIFTTLHPADQLHAFIELQKTGQSAAEIGDLLGFSTHHVQKCLRLANMAPELLMELDADNITLDQLQALTGTTDHERQVIVWNNAFGRKKEPRHLREAVEETKTPVENNRLVNFVGLDADKLAGGTLEIDLFTESGFIENAPVIRKIGAR